MIFKQWRQVLDGTKTQTRRLVKPNELASGSRGGGQRWIHAVWIDVKGVHDRRHEQHGFIKSSLVVLEELYRLKWAVAQGVFADKTYAVQPGRGKKAVGRIRITEIKRGRLQDITPQAAKAEGVDPYIVYGWGIDYIGYEQAFVNLWDGIYKEPGKQWQDNPEVWVLTFELVDGS